MLLLQSCTHLPLEHVHRRGLIDSIVGVLGYHPHHCIICDTFSYRRVTPVDWSSLMLVALVFLTISAIVAFPIFLSISVLLKQIF